MKHLLVKPLCLVSMLPTCFMSRFQVVVPKHLASHLYCTHWLIVFEFCSNQHLPSREETYPLPVGTFESMISRTSCLVGYVSFSEGRYEFHPLKVAALLGHRLFIRRWSLPFQQQFLSWGDVFCLHLVVDKHTP